MRMHHATASRTVLLAACGLLCGCSALLGIEELSSEPGTSTDAGDGGGAGTDREDSGTAPDMDAAVSVVMDGSTASDMDGSTGDAGLDGGDTTPLDAGDADTGNPDSGADSGTPDSGPPPDLTVTGKVIDYFGKPVGGAVVTVDGTSVASAGDGTFTLTNAGATYDVGLTLTVPRYGGTEVSGWLYVGLTRRDPTLQVYRGLPLDYGYVDQTITNVSFPLANGERIDAAFAGSYGTYGDFTSSITTASQSYTTDWQGPAMVPGTVHALRWLDATAAPNLPTSYLAVTSSPLTLDDSSTVSLSLDLMSAGPLSAATVSGTVSAGGPPDRVNRVFVRFNDDAAIRVVDDGSATNAFSYLVPTIANSSVTVVAIAETSGFAPLAVAYADGIAPGTSGIALTLPTPAAPVLPSASATNVTASTDFSWTGPNQVYIFHATSLDYYEDFYVVTARQTARLPAPPLTALVLEPSPYNTYEWSVAAHGGITTVDQAAGPEGHLGPYDSERISGPRHGNGTYSDSQHRTFTTGL